MAFKLRGNIFNNNTGSPLLRSNKAGSPFLNSNKCNKYGVVNGKTVCIERVGTKTFADDQGFSYQEVYNKLPTNEAGEVYNPKTGTVYTDVSQFEAEAIASRKTIETRDITKGKTTTTTKKKKKKKKKKKLPTRAQWCAKYPSRCKNGKPKEKWEEKNRKFKEKQKQKRKNETITSSSTTPDTISGWEAQN